MLSIFLLIKKLLKFLNSNESVENIAFSLTIALCVAIIPFNLIMHLLLLLLLIGFNGNLFIFLFITPILNIFTSSINLELHNIGNYFLGNDRFLPIFEQLNDVPFLIFINWNNTVTFGSYILSLCLSIPTYFFYKFSINKYRQIILPKLKQSKLFHLLKVPSWVSIFKR